MLQLSVDHLMLSDFFRILQAPLIEPHGEDRPVAQALQGGGIGCLEQGPGLVVAEGGYVPLIHYKILSFKR